MQNLRIRNIENKRQPILVEDDEELEPKIEKQVKLDLVDKDLCPWYTKQTSQIKNPTVRLHNEIIDFFFYIQPTEREHLKRLQAFERVKIFLKNIVPGCQIEAFGSFKTKLYLPTADMDLVLIDESQSTKSLYKKVAAALMNQSQKFEGINLIANAKVPIIKFIEISTQFHFDLSFNKMDGLKQITELQKAFDLYPEMKYMIVIIKCILRQRDLHETYSGGIGSFLLFQMVLAYLREVRRDLFQKNKEEQIKTITLAEYLLKFLEFYGSKFELSRKRIIMTNGGEIVSKPTHDDRFSLMSPQDPDHDIGYSSYKIKEIFKIFANRFNFMTNYNYKVGESVLRYLVNPSDEKFTYIRAE